MRPKAKAFGTYRLFVNFILYAAGLGGNGIAIRHSGNSQASSRWYFTLLTSHFSLPITTREQNALLPGKT